MHPIAVDMRMSNELNRESNRFYQKQKQEMIELIRTYNSISKGDIIYMQAAHSLISLVLNQHEQFLFIYQSFFLQVFVFVLVTLLANKILYGHFAIYGYFAINCHSLDWTLESNVISSWKLQWNLHHTAANEFEQQA